MKKNKLLSGFFSRILLFNTVLICVVSAISSYFISTLATQYQQTEVLKKYEIALNQLYSNFNEKHENFANLLNSFFSDTTFYNNTSTLLNTSRLDNLDAGTKAQLVSVFERLCEKDSDIAGVLIYSPEQKTLFQFNLSGRTITQLPMDGDFPISTSFSRLVLTDSMLKGLSKSFVSPEPHLYALGANLSTSVSGKYKVIGQVIILYSTSGLYQSISNRELGYDSIFSILDSGGNVLFNSDGNYQPVPANQIKETSSTFTTVNQIPYYTATLANPQRNFNVSYLVRKSSVDISSNYMQGLILLISAIICIFSVISYLIFYRLSSKKIHLIEKGMKRIGSNNLLYRIPPTKGSDEFTFIIHQFNQMCDELQQNIEKAYIYELQQKNAELYALQTSINPHFLYNTLEVIRVRLNQEHCPQAAEMIVLLSKIYRNQIKGQMFLSIFEEMNQCTMFIDLYLYRFDNFEYSFQIPQEFYSYGIPKNTLQPVVENYFVHGIDPSREDNYIEIRAEWAELNGERCIKISLCNNGKSISEETLQELKNQLTLPVLQNKGSGFGLANVNTRLRIVFGEGYGMDIHAGEDGTGVQVDILIKPLSPEELIHTYDNVPKL